MLAHLLLLGPAGCGLKEYEERMDQERKRAKSFDYTENLLEDRLEPPSLNDKSLWRFEVFLRVPRGCQRTFKSSYGYGDLKLYRYPFTQDKGRDDKADSPEKPGWNLFVACPTSPVASSDEFRRRVVGALKEYYSTEFKIRDFDAAMGKVDKIELEEVELDKVEFTGPRDFHFQLYVHRDGSNQIALVFQTLKEASTFSDSRDACLKTLDIGESAVQKKMGFVYKPRK